MSATTIRAREWVLLASTTAAILGILLLAALMPTICAAAGSCSPSGRLVPAVLGAVAVTGLAAGTAVVARRRAGRTRDGVSRSEGVIAAGALLIGVVGIVFAVVTTLSAGFAVPFAPW